MMPSVPQPNPFDSTRWAFVFIAPALLGLLVFTYVPTLVSLGLSFTQWNLLGTPQWVGIQNYERLLNDPLFWQVLKNTGVFAFGAACFEVALGLGLALLLNQPLKGRLLFRGLYFLPYITPLISISVVWGWLYQPEYGLLNLALQQLQQWPLLEQLNGGKPIAWLYDPKTALGAVMALQVWKQVGYHTLVFLAGLQALPESLLESATLDGANACRRFWAVILPMMTPTLFFVMTVSLINGFQVFDAVYLLTQGGPQHATTVLVYWVFQNAFEFYQVGKASAVAYVLFVLILLLTVIQWQCRKRWVLYEDGGA